MVIRQTLTRHVERHHAIKVRQIKKKRKLEKAQIRKFRKQMIQFMVECGLGLDTFKKPSWKELLESISGEVFEKESLQKLSPSARTVVRQMVEDRDELIQEIQLRGSQLVQQGRLQIMIDHKKFKLRNDTNQNCLALLLIVTNEGSRSSFMLNFRPVPTSCNNETISTIKARVKFF